MIPQKIMLRIKLDNAYYNALKNTVLPNISYYLIRYLVEVQLKTNG